MQPTRERPLAEDESKTVTRDLNVIYINVVGVIDNLAWAAVHQRAPEAVACLHQSQVGLFSRSVRQIAALHELTDQIDAYRPWFEELRRRRDPSAHQIPLYLPPAMLGSAEQEEHQRLTSRANEAAVQRDWEAWGELLDQQRRLGRFVPVFVHALDQPIYHFYPVIPEDIGYMVKLVRVATKFLQECMKPL